MKPRANPPRSPGRQLQICVVFDESASVLNADVLIRRVASNDEFETHSFQFDELDQTAGGMAAARSASETDILILAMRDDCCLPSRVRLWLGLCLGLRGNDRDGALVALITQTAGAKELDASLVGYLKTMALVGGFSFFVKRRTEGLSARANWKPADPVPDVQADHRELVAAF